MIGLVMAGGRGSRMKAGGEKLLLRYKKPVIMHVIDALADSGCFSKVRAAVSPNSPRTREYLQDNGVSIVETPGLGYVEDLTRVLQSAGDDVLASPGDLPLLDGDMVKKMVSRYDPDRTWTSFVVTRGFLESLGLSSGFSLVTGGQDCVYTGISAVNARDISDGGPAAESHVILDDRRVAFNLNTKRDYDLLGAA